MFQRPRWTGFLLLILLWIGVQTCQAQDETRALWVTRWDYETPNDILTIIDNAASCGFNTIFFQVRGNATVYYPSDYEPWSEAFDYRDPGWNPLKLAVEFAHNRNLDLHAWVNVYPGWRGKKSPDHGSQLFYLHPDWFMVDRFGTPQGPNNHYYWLSPTHPAVSPYLLRLFRELYTHADVDGIHLDYIRYPSPEYSFDSESVQAFTLKFGSSPGAKPETWVSYRRDAITELVADLYSSMKQYDPDLVLTASVFKDYAMGNRVYLQDSHAWLARGIIDALYPMLYTRDNKLFVRYLFDHHRNSHERHIYPGIFVYDRGQLDTQIKVSKKAGCPGIAIFSYQKLFPDHQQSGISRWLKSKWSRPAKPAPMPWKQRITDNQGPYITQVHTVPLSRNSTRDFKIAAQIVDPSNVYDDNTGSEGKGIYLIYDREWPPQNGIEVRMSPVKTTKNWYITDTPIRPQDTGLDFRCRIFAWDNYQESAGRPKRNLGYSDVWSLSILTPDHTYISAGEFGPVLQQPSSIALDRNGRIWIGSQAQRSVIILNPDGSEAHFSPLTHGLDNQDSVITFGDIRGLAYAPKDIMYVASDTASSHIFRFHTRTGEPLRGIDLDYGVSSIDCDHQGYLFALEYASTRFRVLTPTGLDLMGSPFGLSHTANDIAVTDNAMMIWISDRTEDGVQCWHGAVEGLRARYWQEDNLNTVDIGVGNVFTLGNESVYVPHSTRGIISIFDRAGRPIEYLSGGNPPLNAPKDLTVSASGDSLFVLEASGQGPTKLKLWTRRGQQ